MLERNPVVAIIRSKHEVDLVSAVQALFDGGLEAVEITLNTPGALEAVRRLSGQLPADQWIGCGTVTGVDAARAAREAGARFLVTPTLDPETIAYAVEHSTPILPGAFTPTEIHQADRLGATIVKVFPADRLGPSYLRTVLAPLPDLKLMPTGGVTLESLDAWREAGAVAVGVGSTLHRPEWIERGDYASIRQAAEEWTAAISDWR